MTEIMKPLTREESIVLGIASKGTSAKPIGRFEMVNRFNQQSLQTRDERRVRAFVERLRRKGYLILSRAGRGGGYYMARTEAEYYTFLNRELKKKAASMSITKAMMDKAARAQFGELQQMPFEFKLVLNPEGAK